jgi:kynurenine---oxoglutarate transaminase / cysteine-S-conjugate beta-lyase / glutamine---phenylpyruvate transaminase
MSPSDKKELLTPFLLLFNFLAQKKSGFGAKSVWAEFTPLAVESNAINLGQGFPDLGLSDGPESLPKFVLSAAQESVYDASKVQYSRIQGSPRLVNALAAFYSPRLRREIDPLSEVLVTVGATEGLFSSIQAFVGPGDEMLMVDPHYDWYVCPHVAALP